MVCHRLVVCCAILLSAALQQGCGSRDPYFETVLPLEDTRDTLGPYRLEAWVTAPRGTQRVILRIHDRLGSDVFGERHLALTSGDTQRGRWAVSLGGRPAGTHYEYYLVLTDKAGISTFWPAAAPEDRMSFRVVAERTQTDDPTR